MTLGFVGFGNIAAAIATGVLKAGLLSPEQIFAYDINRAGIDSFKSKHPINSAATLSELSMKCDTVILSVKPQNYKDVLSALAQNDISETVFVSVAAGISIARVKSFLGTGSKVVRVMPNTPLLLGVGATAACKCENVSDDEFRQVCALFECSGTLTVLDEEQMNPVISVNGSAPAYLFLLAKAVCDYGEKCGIDRESAKLLFAQTMIGSAKMITDSGDELQTLIDKVTSKGGTTAKALEKLYDAGFEDIVKSAMEACTKRADELGQE